MSAVIATALVGSLVGAGMMLNKASGGRQPREEEHKRMQIALEELPNQRNAYHSERYYDSWNQEFALATETHLKAQDPVNENVLPLYYNQMSLRQEMSPQLQAYVEKRGQRLKNQDFQSLGFINEGGAEMGIEESPMFRPLGFGLGAAGSEGAVPEQTAGQASVEGFDVANRSFSNPNGTAVTKEEHFQSYTVHGPVNSNNPNFHNNMVPFYGSHVTQNTDPEAHQHLLERFTGQTNSSTELRSQPKREIPSLADRTPGQTFIYGSPVDMAVQTDRYITSNFKRDVTPFQQIRVGPGISQTYDAKPRDGFQTWWRPPYRNVDELRVNPKNVYEGRLLPGKEQVTNRGFVGDVYKRRPDTFYINDQRRWNRTTGAFTAPQIRQNFVAYKQNREDTNLAWVGPAGNHENLGARPGVYGEGSCVDSGGVCANGELMRGEGYPSFGGCLPSDSLLPDAPEGDIYSEANTDWTGELDSGAPCSLSARVQHSDKNQLAATPFRNWGAQSYLTQQQKRPYDKARANTRATAYVRDYQGIASAKADNVKPTKRPYDKARTNLRSTMLGPQNYVGQVGQEGLVNQQQYFYDKARANTRSTAYVRDYQGIVGAPEDNRKPMTYLYDKARQNTRNTAYVRDYQGIASANADNQKPRQYLFDKARQNTRNTAYVRDYVGISSANADNQKARKYLYDKARNNTRNTVNIRDYVGIAGSVQTRQPVSYECEYNATTKNNMESLLEGRTYGPNKATNITVGACDVNMQIRARTGYDITRYGPNETRLYQTTPSIEHGFAATTSQNQRDQDGVRQPEDFVVEQFNRNPYTQSLQSATPLTTPFRRGETPFNGCDPQYLSDPRLADDQERRLMAGAMQNETF
jgi:hypothetical protein